RDGCHVHDAAPAPLLHVRPDSLRAVEPARQVDPEVALPQLRLLVAELREVVERAGVVDEDVERSVLLDDAPDGLVHLRAIADVARDRRVLFLDVENDDLRTGALQRQRIGPAEPARTSCDESDAPREVDLNHATLRAQSRGMSNSRAITS